MAITTYAELQASIIAYVGDSSLSALVPDFITLAEAEFNRVLRVPAMEVVATALTSAATETVALPADFRAMKSLTLMTSPTKTLGGSTVSTLQDMHGGTTGEPQQFAVADGALYLGPVPDAAYTLRMAYWQRIPALSVSNTTNWLLTAHPDLYLFAALMQSEFYGWNDGRLPLIKARADELLVQISEEGRRAAFPSRMVLSHGVRGG